jgi:hypothetical protein
LTITTDAGDLTCWVKLRLPFHSQALQRSFLLILLFMFISIVCRTPISGLQLSRIVKSQKRSFGIP